MTIFLIILNVQFIKLSSRIILEQQYKKTHSWHVQYYVIVTIKNENLKIYEVKSCNQHGQKRGILQKNVNPIQIWHILCLISFCILSHVHIVNWSPYCLRKKMTNYNHLAYHSAEKCNIKNYCCCIFKWQINQNGASVIVQDFKLYEIYISNFSISLNDLISWLI